MRNVSRVSGALVEVETQNFAPAPGIGVGLTEIIVIAPAINEVWAFDWPSLVVAPPPGAGAGFMQLSLSDTVNTIFTQGTCTFNTALEYQYLGWQAADLGQLPAGAPAQQELVSKMYSSLFNPLQIIFSNQTDVIAGIGRFYVFRYRRLRL